MGGCVGGVGGDAFEVGTGDRPHSHSGMCAHGCVCCGKSGRHTLGEVDFGTNTAWEYQKNVGILGRDSLSDLSK